MIFHRILSDGDCWRSRDELISDILLWTPTYSRAKAGRPARTFSSYKRIPNVALKTCQRRWTIGKSDERWSGISVLVARRDDDDEIVKMVSSRPVISKSSSAFISHKFSFFLLITLRSGLLAEIKWSIFMSKSHRSLCVSFSRTAAGLFIYHLSVLSCQF